jgi:hypothetical protein
VIWLTWRQQRTETLIAALLLALVAALLVPTGLHMASVYDSEGIAACLADSSGGCGDTLDSFAARWDTLLNVVGWLNLVPALVGALLAAPFVLEFERGTFRLAWTQSVTRGRWLAVRLGLIVGAAVAASALLTLLMTWWRGPLDDVSGRFAEGFDLEGFVPTAYTLFAAALVIAVGVVLRRTAAAIGLAFVAFLAFRIGIATWARPNYQEPIRETGAGSIPADELRDAWVFSQQVELRAADGQPADPAVVASCVLDATTKTVDEACLAQHDIVRTASTTYHPGDRFWLFQAIEAGIYVTLAAALLAFAVWWIRKRIS